MWWPLRKETATLNCYHPTLMLLITSELVAPMTMMVKMMVTRTLGLITSEVVAPGGKEGEL